MLGSAFALALILAACWVARALAPAAGLTDRRALAARAPVALAQGDELRVSDRARARLDGIRFVRPARSAAAGILPRRARASGGEGSSRVRDARVAVRRSAPPRRAAGGTAREDRRREGEYRRAQHGRTRCALRDQPTRSCRAVASLTTIGTPHYGTPLADTSLIMRECRCCACAAARAGSRRHPRSDHEADAGVQRYGARRARRTLRELCRLGARRYRDVHALLAPGFTYLSRRTGDNDGMVSATSQRWGRVCSATQRRSLGRDRMVARARREELLRRGGAGIGSIRLTTFGCDADQRTQRTR